MILFDWCRAKRFAGASYARARLAAATALPLNTGRQRTDTMSATGAVFPMYDFAELASAHDRLWQAVVARTRRAGFSGGVPLLQVCGYPLMRSLRTLYEIVARPCYDVAFCGEATHRGLLVVAADAPYAGLADVRGTRFAVNALESNTGTNLPRRLLAPLAGARRFFRQVIVTGGHAASLDAVRTGAADAASIDSVTFALLAEHRPRAVAGLRILAATAESPTPPFVTPRATEPRLRALLYDALASAVSAPELADVRNALHLSAVRPATLETYAVLIQYEREAVALGYGELG